MSTVVIVQLLIKRYRKSGSWFTQGLPKPNGQLPQFHINKITLFKVLLK